MDRGKEKSGVVAQTSFATPPLFLKDAICSTTVACKALVRDNSDTGLRVIVAWRVANVATVIISIESITDVKRCNRVRAASDEEVQNSSQKVAEKGTQMKFNLVS